MLGSADLEIVESEGVKVDWGKLSGKDFKRKYCRTKFFNLERFHGLVVWIIMKLLHLDDKFRLYCPNHV